MRATVDWLARRIVQIYPDDALRKEPEIEGVEGPEADKIWAEYHRLNTVSQYPQGVLAHGLYQGRALGGAVILLGFKSGKPDQPAPEPGKNSSCYWYDVVPWQDLQIAEREGDANSAEFGRPKLLKVGGDHPRKGQIFHVSRTIACEGLPRAIPRSYDATPWLSVLQPCVDAIKDYGLSWESVSLLLQEASVGVLKVAGLIRLISKGSEDALARRQKLMSEGRSAAKTIFLDADFDESFSRTEVSFDGIPEILGQLQMRLSGAAQIPVTRLFGRSPAGENATGESDMRIFYDDVTAYRQRGVEPKQTRLLSLIAGKPVTLAYPPLQEMSEAETAQIRWLEAQTDEKRFDLGVYSAQEIADSRNADGSLGITLDPAITTRGAAPDATA